MLFIDFLKAVVMISGVAASGLAAVTVAGASADQDPRVVFVSAGWWVIAAGIGIAVGRRRQVTTAIGRLLASARMTAALPDIQPSRVLLNRLWPLLLSTISAGALTIVAPQIPGVAAGFAIIWALAWRHQDGAVAAIEERDGARFYIERTPPHRPIRLVRTPGLKSNLFELNGGGSARRRVR